MPILLALLAFLRAIAPAAIGSAVGSATETGLSWRTHLVAWAVGLGVSYVIAPSVAHFYADGSEQLAAAIDFSVALVAYKAVPAFRDRAVALIASIPDRVAAMLGRSPHA